MKRTHFYFIFLIAAGICTSRCASPQNQPAQETPASAAVPAMVNVENGKKLFEEKCQLCHGTDGTAGIAGAANLQQSKLDTLHTISIVTAGKNAMPSFREQLGTGEIEQIAHYVFSLRK